MPDSYDTSAEYLRSRVEQIAQEISQKVQSRLPAGQVQPFFICDIVNVAENVVNGVVNVAHDVVNAAVNATQDVVNAAENVAERAVNIGERAINATEEVVNAVTAHTQHIVQVANLATDAIKVATFVAEFVGAAPTERGAPSAEVASQASYWLSADQEATTAPVNSVYLTEH
jgi:phage-related protein